MAYKYNPLLPHNLQLVDDDKEEIKIAQIAGNQVTITELNNLKGSTSNIQEQINNISQVLNEGDAIDFYNNQINVKYDKKTISINESGELYALTFDSSELEAEMAETTRKVTEIEETTKEEIQEIKRDLTKKVSKFFSSIDELEIGEIGEYQGETNDQFVRGYFYERGYGNPIVYEDISIPVGSKKIIYTNKFDNSQKVVYAYEEQQLDAYVVTQYSQQGKVYLIDDTVHQQIINNSTLSPNLIDSTQRGLIYTIEETIRSIYANISDAGTVHAAKTLYEYLNNTYLTSGFTTSTSEPATIGRVDDAIMSIRIPVLDNGSSTTNSYKLLLSDLAGYNWDIDEYIKAVYPTLYDTSNARHYDNTQDVWIYFWNIVITTEEGNKYNLSYSGGSGQRTNRIYRTVSDDGEYERYIDVSHLLCVFDSNPASSENEYWAQIIDLDLYFNYNVAFENTTEVITIRRKKQYYDEYGFPIVESPAVIRVDTQPAGANDTYDIEEVSATEGFYKSYSLVKTDKDGNKTYLGVIDLPKDLFLKKVSRVTISDENPVSGYENGEYFRFDFNTADGVTTQYIPLDTLKATMTAGRHITITNDEISATGFVPQYSDLDDAQESETIVQFVGESGFGYISGYFYKRTTSGWQQIDVQPHATIPHTHDISDVYDGDKELATATAEDIENLVADLGAFVEDDDVEFASAEDIVNIFG